MAEDKNVNIKITTEANTEGIKKVEKELDDATKKLVDMDVAADTFDDQADQVDALKKKLGGLKDEFAKTTKKADGGFKKMFPTFSKLGGSLKGLAGGLVGFLNPVTIGLAAVTAAVGFAIDKYKKWQEGIERATKLTGTAINSYRSDLKSLLTTERASAVAVDEYARAQKLAAERTDERTASIRRLEREQLATTDAELALNLSKIDIAEAEGKLSEEAADGARLKARRDAEDAKVLIKRKADTEELIALEKKLTEQRAELGKVQNDRIEATRRRDELLNAKGDKVRAAGLFDPSLNANVDEKNKAEQAASDKFDQDKSKENEEVLKKISKEREEAEKARTAAVEDKFKEEEAAVKDFDKGLNSLNATIANTSRLAAGKRADFNSNETAGAQVRATRRKAEDNLLLADNIRKANGAIDSPALAPEKQSFSDRLAGGSAAFAGGRSGTVDRANFNELKDAAKAAEDGTDTKELSELVVVMKKMAVSQRTFNAKKQASFNDLKLIVEEMKSQLENGPGARD